MIIGGLGKLIVYELDIYHVKKKLIPVRDEVD